MEKYKRKCSITNEGMNEGYVILEGDFYAKTEESLIKILRSIENKKCSDEVLLDESYKNNTYYYTEWYY